jgi:hypothetical protein
MTAPIGEVFLVPAILISLVSIANSYEGKEALQAIYAVIPAYAVGLIFCAVLDRNFRRLLRRQKDKQVSLLHHSYLGYAAFALLYFIGIYVAIFMTLSYPRIPEQFGGGRPSNIWLLLKEDSLESAKELGIPIPQGSTLTEKLQLMYEGSDAYVLRLPP